MLTLLVGVTPIRYQPNTKAEPRATEMACGMDGGDGLWDDTVSWEIDDGVTDGG